MNSKDFIRHVFEEVWEPGASVHHYMMDIMKSKRYTYEQTLDMIKTWKNESKKVYRITTIANDNEKQRCEECGVIEDLTNTCCDRCHNKIYGTTY